MLGTLEHYNLYAEQYCIFLDLYHYPLTLLYSAIILTLPLAAKLENPEGKYLTGWSRGKETLKNGQVDTLKGSYYANCAFYVSPDLTSAIPTPEFSLANFPEYLSPNIWPPESLLPCFRQTFEELCTLIIDTGVLVARACDRYAHVKIPDYRPCYCKLISPMSIVFLRLMHGLKHSSRGGSELHARTPFCIIFPSLNTYVLHTFQTPRAIWTRQY